MAALRVLHLVGSAVDGFAADLSRLYARDCLAAIADPAAYDPLIAYVSPDARWCFPESLDPAAIAAAPPMPIGEAVRVITDARVELAVPQMFCLPGMTTYRALLDALRIPYIGNRPDVMAIGAHKQRARAIVAAAGVPVPEGEVVPRGGRPALEPPFVVLPVDADNSLGVTLVDGPSGVDAALAAALEHSDSALVERYVELGREVRCGLVERDGQLVRLPLEEYAVDPAARIRMAADKVAGSGDAIRLVAKTEDRAWIVPEDDPVVPLVEAAARRAHAALGCRHYSLFDFRIDPEGQPWFLEAGLYCSFARQSVIAVMAAAAGIPVDDLFRDAAALALS